MSHIRGKNTSVEMAVRKIIFSMGYRYRLHAKDLPGKPDLVFRKKRKVVFIHGCFWHQHKGCKDGHIPKSNGTYWKPKLRKTVKRDMANQKKLLADGWRILVVWECYLSGLEKLGKKIKNFLDTA
jgi:DNA mismatch endonuclease (patch repair protein)